MSGVNEGCWFSAFKSSEKPCLSFSSSCNPRVIFLKYLCCLINATVSYELAWCDYSRQTAAAVYSEGVPVIFSEKEMNQEVNVANWFTTSTYDRHGLHTTFMPFWFPLLSVNHQTSTQSYRLKADGKWRRLPVVQGEETGTTVCQNL